MPSVSAVKSKVDSIIDNLTRLATAYNEPLNPDRIEVYTIALADLTPDELSHGFNRALRETKWWPKPSELIEFCTGRASAMTDKLRIDAAWNWTRRYVEMHGLDRSTRWELQGHGYTGVHIQGAINRDNSFRTLATTAPFYELTCYPVPQIPALVQQTMIAMGGTVKMGLTRIKDAMRGWSGSDDINSKDSAFARKDFDEYCSRAIAAERANTPAMVNPSMQLTGAVAPEFPNPRLCKLAACVKREGEKYTICRLTFAAITALHLAGKLPQHLYEEAARHHREVEQERMLRDTPAEFNAVYLRPYRYSCTQTEKWGLFTVENADGTKIVFDGLPMLIGDMHMKPGQAVRFSAKPNQLGYKEFPRFYFDLTIQTTNRNMEITDESK